MYQLSNGVTVIDQSPPQNCTPCAYSKKHSECENSGPTESLARRTEC